MSTTSYISTLLAIRYMYDFNPEESMYWVFLSYLFVAIRRTHMYKEDSICLSNLLNEKVVTLVDMLKLFYKYI